MSDSREGAAARLVLAYRPEGFCRIGGLQRIAQEVVDHLRGLHPERALATLASGAEGTLPHTSRCARLGSGDQLLIVGCDSPWAYGLALRARQRGLPVSWLPSFHDPASAIHRQRARMAQRALRALQHLGVVVHVQTAHEQQLLGSGRGLSCRLSGHGMPATIRRELLGPPPLQRQQGDRPIDLLYLGRPTAQKGWLRFVQLSRNLELRCEAIVPTPPPQPAAFPIHGNPSDATVRALLGQAKLVVIPARYESFGIAQLEALMAGCLVPILGQWPLWDGCPVLQWQNLDQGALAEGCRRLCADEGLRQRLRQAQLDHLRRHPILRTPVLPGLP